MANMPFKNVVDSLLGETGSTEKTRARLGKLYSGEELEQAISTLNAISADFFQKRKARDPRSVGSKPGVIR